MTSGKENKPSILVVEKRLDPLSQAHNKAGRIRSSKPFRRQDGRQGRERDKHPDVGQDRGRSDDPSLNGYYRQYFDHDFYTILQTLFEFDDRDKVHSSIDSFFCHQCCTVAEHLRTDATHMNQLAALFVRTRPKSMLYAKV